MDGDNSFFVIKVIPPDGDRTVFTGLSEEAAAEFVKLIGKQPGLIIVGNAMTIKKHYPEDWKKMLASELFNE